MDTSAIIMLGSGYDELLLDGGDGISGPGGGSGFTVPVMASLGQGTSYGVDSDQGAPSGPSVEAVLELIASLTGAVAPVVQAAIMASANNGSVDIDALLSSLNAEADAASAGTSTSGMTMEELLSIVALLQNNPTPPPPEPEGLHPAVWASIAIGGVSVIMLIAALLMGRGGRNTRIKALLNLRNLRKPKQRRLASPW